MKTNKTLNHTASYLLAAAVLKLYPKTKLGIGLAIKEGFYYDFLFENPLQEHDLLKIEKQMHKIVGGGYKIIKSNKEINFSEQPFKEEVIVDLKNNDQTISFYSMINPSSPKSIFDDVCVEPHLDSIKKIKHFKLLSLAGSYWKGGSKNQQLTRIYGTAWENKAELLGYLALLQERKERDHRLIGAKMEIFTFHPLAVQGFPIWLANGMIIKNLIQQYIRKKDKEYLFNEVQTPAFGSKKLYETSGHLKHYQDVMFKPIKLENDEIIMRPMTCPHHLLLFNLKRHSYRELPIRYSEQSRLYRYEKSGALTGLERVRSMELTEGHILCRQDQIVSEFKRCYKLIKDVLDYFQIEISYISLSMRDPDDHEKYYNDDLIWEKAENAIKKVLKDLEIKYEEKIGEAAFYGPKLDIQVKSALEHDITLSTIQLDFLLPQKFEAHYINDQEQKETPILIHRGLIGTYERFIAILLEQTKGNLPFWLAPKQIVVIPILNSKHLEYAKSIFETLKKLNYRVTLNNENQRLGKKIHNAQTQKIKYQIIVGDNELETKTINIREYGSTKNSSLTISHFLNILEKQKK